MILDDALTLENTICNENEISSKKQLLECVGHAACRVNNMLNYVDILQALIKRERLGSTALGHGVAIPHARIESLEKPIVSLITLSDPIKFYENETIAIDIIFGILVPVEATEQQLGLLADISTRLKAESYRDALRTATTNDTLYHAALTNPGANPIANENTDTQK